jgi:IS5 family transposase
VHGGQRLDLVAAVLPDPARWQGAHPTTLMKLTTRCRETAVAVLNEALPAKAAGAKLLRAARMRAETTVIPANVAYPTDSGLLARAVGKLTRTVRRVQAAGGATGTSFTDRRRAAARRVREIVGKLRTQGKLSREETTQVIRRVTGELSDLAEKAEAEAEAEAVAVLRNGRRALPRALSGRVRGRLRRALDELAVTIERTEKIITQTRTRLGGQKPESATRLVSLHDPDARPIRKGRIDRPVEFGYKAQVIDNDDGIVLDYSVEHGAAPDGPQLAPPRSGSPSAPAGCPARSPPTAATVRPLSSVTCANLASGPWRSPARPPPRQPARPSSTAAASASWSNGEPDAKAGLATSNAATAGTAPSSTAGTEPRSGAGTGYSPTTWSRSAH